MRIFAYFFRKKSWREAKKNLLAQTWDKMGFWQQAGYPAWTQLSTIPVDNLVY